MKFVNETMGPVLSVPDPAEPWKERQILNPFLDRAKETGSFEEYVKGHYHDTYLREIRGMVSAGVLPVGRTSREVPEPDDVFVSGISIVRIQFGMDEFVFDPDPGHGGEYPVGYPFSVDMRAVIDASIIVSETWEKMSYSDTLTQWYQVDGHVVFYPDRQEFHPVDRICIYDRDRPPLENPLTQTLAPYIGSESLDTVAYRILDAFYHEALERPCKLKPKKLAARLGLKIRDVCLSEDHSRFGMLVMQDCTLVLGGKRLFVQAGTILVDGEACRRRRGGRKNWAILHECLHYILDRPFYEAQRLYHMELACLCCGTDAALDRESDLFWMEWQAEHLPARLMIPAYVARGCIEKEQERLHRLFPKADSEAFTKKLISAVSDIFGTSLQCTGIRLMELGYIEKAPDWNVEAGPGSFRESVQEQYPYCAEQAGAYSRSAGAGVRKTAASPPASWQYEPVPRTDDHRASPGGTGSAGPQYAIPINVVLNDLSVDGRLRRELESGRYVYADAHFCINDPDYVRYDSRGIPHLTPYAASHVEECCLPFWRRKRYDDYLQGIFHMDVVTGTEIVCGHAVKTHRKTVDDVYGRMKSVIEGLPGTVGGTLKAHMKRLHVTVEDLEELSHVSGTTIKDIRADNCGTLELSFFVAICLGLKLEPPYSLDLIRKTRYQFNAGRDSTMYLLLLTTMYYAGVDACNEVLVSNHFRPLTRKLRAEIP